MFLQGTAKAAMKTLVKRVNASTPEKQTGDVRIGAILEYVTVSHLGDQGLGGEIFSVHEFMQDKERRWLRPACAACTSCARVANFIPFRTANG